MPKFGSRSLANLSECDPALQRIHNIAIKHWDHSIVDGRRPKEEQIKNVEKGVSKTLESKHLPDKNGLSQATDSVPYPYNYSKIEKGLQAIKAAEGGLEILEVYGFQCFLAGIAAALDIPIRQGIDWNTNKQFEDQTFFDLFHTELVK